MTSVEKRRSGRKSGGHRKHSDGGYSDTSSGGSFLDETDREVSNLTDRAFRSLCIGDEAVYNDSDLCSSSPCIPRDRQLAFSQSEQGRDREDREREELKRAAHESFSLRVQQYGQDLIHGGMYGAKIHRDPQWEVYGERTQGRVSATFQHSFMETSQQEESLREEQLSFFSNGATEVGSQQRRSRSRVSSLIRAFNSEGQRDGAGMDGKLREWNDETSWDKSALMSIQRELSEFSTPYQPNFNSGHFPSAGPFTAQDGNFYSAAVANMNSSSSFMRSSHSKHSMSAQVNCNSNFFIHSEYSPFKVWRDHNRFPFQQGEFSGFMHCSEFPKWYETPMYKELSLEAQPQGPYRFDERSIRHQRNTMAPVVPATPSRSTSTSTMMQRALSVEKRCESELAGHYPHRKRTQSLGANRLQSQRPSTASPTIEMSRRVQETISSVKALQQKIKMMTEQNISAGMTANQQGVLYSNNNSVPFGNSAPTAAPNVVSSNTSTTPFNTSQLLTPSVHAHQEAETSEVRQYAASPQPVEHPPVRAESRGATPDIRMSSYKSRATSLLFNLKDNRKRVKSTYSPPKFKGLETPEKNKQRNTQEPRDTVIDMPDFSDQDVQFTQVEAASHQNVNQYYDPGLPLTAVNSQPVTTHTGQYSDYTSSDYQTALMQGEMVHHSGFTGFIPENYPNYQLANGQNLHEDLSSFTSYKQGMLDYAETHGGDAHRLKPSYTSAETQRLNADNNQTRDYLISKANTEQHFNETAGRESTKVDRYQQLIDNKHDYSNVSSPDRWRQTNSLDTENRSLKTAISPWKQEITAFVEKDQHAQAYQRAATIKEELNFTRDRYRGENQQSINKDIEKIELRESFGVGTFSHKKAELVNPNMSNQLPQHAPFSNPTVQSPPYYGQHQPGAFEDKYVPQHYGHSKENEMRDNHSTQNSNRYTDQEYGNQHCLYSDKDKTMLLRETGSTKPLPKGHERQSLQTMEAKPQIEHNKQKNSLSNPNNASAPTMGNKVERRQFAEVKAEQATAERRKAQHAQEELANAQHWAQVEQPKVESARLILAGQTGSERVKAEQAKAEVTEPDRVNQASTEHIKDKETKGEETEPPREKQSEREQTREQTATEEPRNITEEAGVRHMREGLVEQVKAEQAGAERLKEEHIKTEPAKTEQAEQAGIEEAETEQARRERIKAEQLEEEKARAAQVEREQMEAEQIRAEKVKAEQAEAEQAEAERRKAEQAKLEQMKEQQAKAEKDKSEVVEDISIQANQVNAEQPAKQISNAKEENVDERKAAQFGQTKLELAQAERAKTESMQERFAKPAAKLAQLVKIEPDKVEQVKTELAKAKAELAKIKEKMRGEQKEKARGTVLPREDGNKKDVPSVADANDTEEHKDQATQRDELGPANIGANEYERLREKYGFTDTTSINRNKLSAAGNTASLDTCETPALSLDKVEPPNDEKSKDKHNPTMATANTENGKEGGSFKATEVTESQYVYSETSKEFKLSGADYLHTNVDSATGDTATDDEVKDNRVENLGKRDTLKRTDVSQHRDSDMVKPLSVERKTKSGEHQVGKDPHFTPPRALTSKERAQTKQEILTSKIKAHAEKEISAIKEKGFAKRDGFISKSTTKSIAGSQNINIRQRPPSQEVPKKHESSSNITLKHQTEPSGIQSEPVKSVSTPTSATVPVKSAATASQLADHSQKQVPKEPTKSNNNEPKLPREEKRAGSYIMSTDEGLKENQKRENKSGMKSPIQNKELALKSKQGKQEANQGEMSGKQKETLKDSAAVNTDHLNKKKDNPSKAAVVGEAESSKPMTTEKAESKHGAEDSASSLNLCFAQNETPVADDNLQITGIMVTVHERKPSESNGKSNQEQINAKEKECSNSELEKCHPSSGVEVSEGNKSSKEVSIVKAGNRAVQNTLKEDQTKVSLDNHPENVQKTLGHETEQNNVSGDVSVKKTNFQQVCSSTNTRAQRETQPPTVTVTAKNKTSAETQPLLYKRDTIPGETKDYTNKMSNESSAKSVWKDEGKNDTEEKNPQNMQTAQTNGSSVAKIANTGVHSIDDSSRIHGESLKKHDPQQSVKENMSTVTNSFKSKNIDGINAPPVEEKRHDTTPPKPFKQASPSNQSTEDENLHVSLKCVDENVHIDCIAIRVVPAATKRENLKMEEKHDATTVSSDDITANEHKLDASAGINNEDRTEHLQMKDSSHHKLGKQMPESLKVSNQQNSTKATCENTKAETEKLEKVNQSRKSVDESNIQPMETDYFQVQSVTETHKSANVPYTSDAVSKGGELPGSQSNKAAISNGSHNEGKNKVLALDQSKPAESSTGSVQDENMKRKNRETGDNLASKQGNAPTERQSNKNEKTEAGQAIHIRKQHTENQPRLSARERQSSKNPHPTGEITVKTKPEDKPKPKERASTIPEISAIADYARLKVIVSEDRANEIQEFPPNKKEGFFPLIQTRHSRRPVFTADPQDLSGKEKSFPNKTEVPSKVNKEPKPLVFPITEKEHQRTGMFKLGDKERQEKMLSDVKANDDLKERNKSPTIHLKNQRSEDQGAGADTQRLLQVDQGLHQPSSSLYAPTSSSAVNRPRNTPGSQHLKLVDNPNPCERGEDCSSKAEQLPYFDKDSHPRPTLGQMSNIEDGQQQEKLRKERLATRHEETTAKESTAKLPDKEQASGKEVKKRTEVMKIRDMLEASLAEEERRAAQREEERRAREREAIASKVKEKRQKQREEEERKAKLIEEERAAQEEKEMRAKKREEERRMKETEEKRRLKMEEERRVKLREEEERIREDEERRREKQQEEERAAHKEQQRRAAEEEHQRRAAEEEQQRRAAEEEHQRRAAEEEQQRRAAEEEQQRRAAEEEQQRRAAEEEQQRRAAEEEHQRRAAEEEQQRRAAQEELQRRAAEEEQQRRAAEEEQRRKAAQEEQQRRAALFEEQQRKAAQEEQQRRAAQEELQRRAAEEEQQRRAAEEEQQRRAAEEEQQRRAAEEEHQRRAALFEEQQRKAAQEEQQRRAAREEQWRRAALIKEQQRKAAEEEQQRRAAEEEQQRRAALIEEQQRKEAEEEQNRRAAQEEQQRRAALIEEQRRAKQMEEILADIEEEKKRKQKEDENAAQLSKQAKRFIEEQGGENQRREQLMRIRREEAERKIVQGEKTITNQREEKQPKEESTKLLEESQVALIKQKRVAQEQMFAQRADEIRAKKREEEEKLAAYREKERVTQMEEQKRAAPKVDALQYYAITSAESERKPRERQPCSPLPSQRRNNTPGLESTEDHHSGSHRPHAPASPAPSLPRSSTSSPALGVKPLMFRVKDNTMRGSSLTKSIKPRFHKNFGDDFRVGSPMGSERGEEEQETIRRSAVTPVHSDTGLNRLAAIKDSSTFQQGSSMQDYSAPPQHHRPYSRRSLALDEDDSRSIISNISEDVESFATSAADLAELRGLYDYDRPESACSFSSDVSRSLGKPPAVPPKSEKALRRAQRLTTRRIKKELSKGGADSTARIQKPLQEVSSTPSSSSTEVCSSGRHAVASPHFSQPVSLAHAPAPGSSLPEHHSSFYASPHATGPISLPLASPHATAPVSLPVTSPHATGPASHPSAKIVADVPSSPTFHHANHPAPVTQYHVESGYPQAYPLTQRKVLQDLGSGQYFVVDVPVQVKTKTFFDPETGKYVQLNVRESAKSTSRSQPQQTYLQPQLQPQTHVKPQQHQPPSQNSPASKPNVLYQGLHGYPGGYQTPAVNSVSHNRSSAPVTLHTDQQSVRESHIYGYPAAEMGQNSEGHRYSPEKTPYMDTVNDKDKTRNTVYNTHESFPECDTNSQLAGSSVCENGNSAPSRCQPRDIITMSELEDFMELSDW